MGKKRDLNARPTEDIVENASVMVIAFNENGRITYANETAREATGYPDTELVRMNADDIIEPESLEKMRRGLFSGKKENSDPIVLFDAALLTSELDLLPVDIEAVSRNPEGDREAVLFARFASPRKKREAELIFEGKLEVLSNMAEGISNDLNDLLTGISGNIDLAMMRLPAEAAGRDRLADAKKGCDGLKELIRVLTSISRGGAGMRPGAIAGTIRASAAVVFSKADPRFTLLLPVSLPSVVHNRDSLRTALAAVLENARDAAGEKGRVRLKASPYFAGEENRSIPSGNYVKITIEDNGGGIPDSHRMRIFDPYFSTKKHGRRRGKGLGMTLAAAVVRKHKGRIHIATQQEGRTAVNIYLPSNDSPDSGDEAARTEHDAGRRRILLMDDEEIILEVTGQMLEQMGFDVTTAADGEQAVEFYRRALGATPPFHVVILDLTVGKGMGGKEAMKQLLEIDPQTKGIVSSGYAFHPEMVDYQKYGFSGFLEKPYTIKELMRVINEVID